LVVSYKVLARAYRPASFEDNFMGQDTTVKILSNAIEAGKLPHAIILSGVRGVGKTTTARILARTINCSNLTFPHGKPKPCGVCDSCKAISEGSCLDVIEMDAASRTSVEDIRDLIESLPYKPALCKYKVYIIDEVHMLSKSAFNALLKTLEEPPSHIKFIFATTELQKVPSTILSRCMRFDLRGFSTEELISHIQGIVEKEEINIEKEALELLVDASGGSARDALSLLDQARHLDDKMVTIDQVSQMLGKADFSKFLSFFENTLEGRVDRAFSALQQLYKDGSNPQELAKNFLDFIYQLSKLRVSNFSIVPSGFSKSEQEHLSTMAKALTTPLLQSLWQIASKGYDDVRQSPIPEPAFEMLLIKLMHVKDFLVGPAGSGEDESSAPSKSSDYNGVNSSQKTAMNKSTEIEENSGVPNTFDAFVSLFKKKKELLLASHIMQDVYLVAYEPFKLKIKLTDHAPKDLCKQLKEKIQKWTGAEWKIEQVEQGGVDKTLYQKKQEKIEELKKEAMEAPLLKEVEKTFPGAKVTKIDPIFHSS